MTSSQIERLTTPDVIKPPAHPLTPEDRARAQAIIARAKAGETVIFPVAPIVPEGRLSP